MYLTRVVSGLPSDALFDEIIQVEHTANTSNGNIDAV